MSDIEIPKDLHERNVARAIDSYEFKLSPHERQRSLVFLDAKEQLRRAVQDSQLPYEGTTIGQRALPGVVTTWEIWVQSPTPDTGRLVRRSLVLGDTWVRQVDLWSLILGIYVELSGN